ncbi:hypothetical protein H6F87_23750 [Cyanobacteria bacterium FACHB-502]|nr:hypothetical protein [Cyanobacteria bacterium FACHB-502]
MTRNRRQSSPPVNQPLRHPAFYTWISLGLLLLLTLASGIFVYQVSPLRDPAFQPNSANAGSLIPGLRQVPEIYWIWGATGLAGLLTTNLVVLLWQLSLPFNTVDIAGQQQQGTRVVRWTVLIVMLVTYVGLGLVLFAGLYFVFVGYLLGQWLVD